jgi:hypothetical protein
MRYEQIQVRKRLALSAFSVSRDETDDVAVLIDAHDKRDQHNYV